MSNNDTKKYNILHISADKEVTDTQILLSCAFVCLCDTRNPLEIIEMLGLTDDLQRVRRSRQQGTARQGESQEGRV